ncbi:hypothetical protein BBB39_09125 [Bordetella trematum]|uniref:Uncharacterized protein n=1 Tax=Bordetella trematum TaxID=123899 RepID=A0A157SP09_9BORD|nr:hypothetical protein [Bordetella trematum]AZR93913.1 hypothetical protein BBB39_09125 [Bordetella trematum]NNH19044.1 hypothetical protein [Bordetella trematum]SAI42877.1 Uncharacterised protein [Bordetella trematum]SAI72190.1 Uncharacterised protein [Bordetella trematum]SUV97939.1 Uncharacterised protein [Bordetella trematum]
MIGHQSLIGARMAGFRPTDVWLTCVPEGMTYGRFTHPEAQIGQVSDGRFVGQPDIHIHDGENASALDLRPVVGLVVHVVAPSKARALQLMRRAAAFSPAKIIAAGEWGTMLWTPGGGFLELNP